MGKTLVLCAFALSLLVIAMAVVGFQESSRAEYLKQEQHPRIFGRIDFPGAMATIAYGINNSGQIVGIYTDQSGFHGFLRDDGNFTPIDYRGARSTAVYGINDSGQIVGNFIDGADKSQSFLWEDGVFTQIDIPNSVESQAKGINNNGQIVGNFIGADRIIHGYLWEGGVVTQIDFPRSAPRIYDPNDGGPPIGINDFGHIVGEFKDDAGAFHGYLRINGVFTQIDYPNATDTSATGINDLGQIVGGFTVTSGAGNGFLKTGTDFQPIGVPFGTNTIVWGVNDLGQMVGWFTADNDGKLHGFVSSGNSP
jgi:probable HAF family extracellular repeat protein